MHASVNGLSGGCSENQGVQIGEIAKCDWLLVLAAEAPRFPANDISLEEGIQEDLIKAVKRLGLTEYHPSTEDEFEDWVDETAARVRRSCASVDVLREAWVRVADRATAEKLAAAKVRTHEDLVDAVARRGPRAEAYLEALEDEILKGADGRGGV